MIQTLVVIQIILPIITKMLKIYSLHREYQKNYIINLKCKYIKNIILWVNILIMK